MNVTTRIIFSVILIAAFAGAGAVAYAYAHQPRHTPQFIASPPEAKQASYQTNKRLPAVAASDVTETASLNRWSTLTDF
jgi:hypothetical protein